MGALVRFIGLLFLAVLLMAITVWEVLALYFAGPQQETMRFLLTALPVMVTLPALIALCFRGRRWQAVLACAVVFAVVLVWWGTIKPSNDREWQTYVAVLPYATVEGDVVTLHNIRNFSYRSEFDYTPAYYDKTYRLSELTGVDLVAVYWMGPAIAHVMMSFEFNDREYVSISIETRKEKSEEYSTIKGFFRQYELYYVVADERDSIRLRTNYRKNPVEDTYVYSVAGDIENGRRVFMEYVRRINALKSQPEFYNTLTTNCTTSIWMNTLVNAAHIPLSWKILVSGYVPEFLFEQGRLQTEGLAFNELQKRAHINARALAAGDAEDFSQRIRNAGDNAPVKESASGVEPE